MKTTVTVELKNKTLTLQVNDFGDIPLNVEELLQVDWSNVIGDIITFPVIYNRLGIIKAEMDDYLREQELDFDLFEAEKRQELRKSLVKREPYARGDGEKVIYPTESEVKDALLRDPKYKVKRTELNKVKKDADMVGALFNAAKSKDKKLDAMSMKLRPEEFETDLIVETINSVTMRAHQKMFAKLR